MQCVTVLPHAPFRWLAQILWHASCAVWHPTTRHIVAKRNKRASNNRIHTQCTNTSSHSKFAVQVDTVINMQYRQAQETFYWRHLIWSQYLWVLHFPTMALFFVTSHKKCPSPPPPLCDIPSGCCSFTGPWTVTRSSLRMLRRVAAFCRPLRPVLLLVSFRRSRSPVVGVLGLCWMWHGVRDCASAAPNNWRIEDVLVAAGVI